MSLRAALAQAGDAALGAEVLLRTLCELEEARASGAGAQPNVAPPSTVSS